MIPSTLIEYCPKHPSAPGLRELPLLLAPSQKHSRDRKERPRSASPGSVPALFHSQFSQKSCLPLKIIAPPPQPRDPSTPQPALLATSHRPGTGKAENCSIFSPFPPNLNASTSKAWLLLNLFESRAPSILLLIEELLHHRLLMINSQRPCLQVECTGLMTAVSIL